MPIRLSAQQRKVLKMIEGGRPIELPRIVVYEGTSVSSNHRATSVNKLTFRALISHGYIKCADDHNLRWYITDKGRKVLND